MTSTILANIPELKAKAGQLMAQAGSLESELNTLRGVADPSGIFQGAAAAAYQETFNNWATHQALILQDLRSLGQWLEAAANAIDLQNEELAKTLGVQLNG
jgi:WXG100 family type VII secretion target